MTATDDLVTAIERYTGRAGKRSGKNIRLLCPAHDDHDPSLDVAEGETGWPLTRCRSHDCTFEQICEAIGHQPSDFAPTEHGEWTPRGTATAIYDYTDATGHLLYQVCRTPDKQFPQRRPDPTSESGWRWNLEGIQRVLYHLPEVLAAAEEGQTIYITEGEKDADAIRKTGAIATCSPGGAGKWRDEYALPLHGAHAIIVADRDEPGIAHANAVAASLAAHLNGTADTIQIVQAKEGKDAHDHFAAGLTLNDFQPLQELAVAAETPVIFETLRSFLERELPPNESLVGVTRDGTNLLPRYGWVMPWGREGSGKTSILVDLIFHACAGIDWLGYPIGRALKIVAIVNEGVPGGLQDKLRQKVERFEQSEAVLDNLAVYASPWGEFTFRNEQIADHARDFARDFEADYVALDPLHTLGTSGAGAPTETEEFKHLLRSFGLWDWLGMLTAHHANKGGMVSGDWARHPDTVIHLEKDGKQPATKLTLQKARPADPAELGVPFLLEWEIDTLGYKRIDLQTTSSFDEDEAFSKATEVLEAAAEPIGKRALYEAIGGHSEHVRKAIDRWLKDGKIVNLTPEKRTFKLVLASSVQEHWTQLDATEAIDAETLMGTADASVQQPGTQPDASPDHPQTGSVASCVPVPVGDAGGRNEVRAEQDTDATDDIPLD